ncbi:hypothetical protein [uncultured Maricaulis sp.]|uniref:hypothetical protein n=1 Tax=uncultured Maricaulis sp. TaxID=174710 RepID=UPI0030D7C4DA|tara:strand:- start:16240 stop:16614 length:375 start_codon:yes stop_codon:yes gene_type:complete
MIYRVFIATTVLAVSFFAISSVAEAQRRTAQPVQDRPLSLCRDAEAGERCRTRTGEVRIRRGQRTGAGIEAPQTNNLGGGDPGWEVHDQRTGAGIEDGQINNLGGGDPGWEVHGDKAPEPEAMD